MSSDERAGERPGERLIGLFFLGCVLFSPLALGVFDVGADVDIAGVPLLVFYLFTAWAVLIAAIATVSRGIHGDDALSLTLDEAARRREPPDA